MADSACSTRQVCRKIWAEKSEMRKSGEGDGSNILGHASKINLEKWSGCVCLILCPTSAVEETVFEITITMTP
jgi:hypothetical protein